MERPPSNSMGFQLPLHNPMPSGGSVQGCPPSFELVFEIYKFDNNHNLIDWCHLLLQAIHFPRCHQAGQIFLVLIVGDQLKVISMYMSRYGNL